MIRLLVPSVALALVLSATAGSTVQAGPSMSTNWTSTTISQQECMRQAEQVVRDAGMDDVDVVGQSVFGKKSGYTAVVRCISDYGLIYFVVGGPQLDQARTYMRSLFDKF